jgi:hypothetical protein
MVELYARENIHINEPFVEQSPFFHKVLDIFLAMVNAPGSTEGKFLFLDRIVLHLLRNIFEQIGTTTGTTTPPDSDLTAWITATLESHVVSITVGAEEDCFLVTRVSPSNSKRCSPTIYWNANWLKDADIRFQRDSTRTDYSHIHLFELNMHLIVGVVKLIHAFVNTLTSKILQYECDIKSSISSSTGRSILPFPHIPVQIGCKFLNRKNKKNSLQGNLGLAAEGLLLGDGLRMKMHYISPPQFSPQYLYFEKSKVIEEQITKKPSRKRKAEESLEEGEENGEGESLLLQSHVYLFRSSFKQILTSLSYLGSLRQVMETYHSSLATSSSSPNAVNLYNAFSVSNSDNTLEEGNIIDTVIPKYSTTRRRRSLPKEERHNPSLLQKRIQLNNSENTTSGCG